MRHFALGLLLGIIATCAAAGLLGLVAWWLGGLDDEKDWRREFAEWPPVKGKG